MTTGIQAQQKLITPGFARKAIDAAAKAWFATVLVGQAIFSYYIVAFYYVSTATWDIERFNGVMPAGYIEGDALGNLAVIAHVLFAAVITFGGLLQLVPTLRAKLPALHRWNGRLYVLTALVMSLSGAFMIITRYDKVIGDLFAHTSLMINGAIIVICAVMAFKRARQRKFAQHRVWALRLFVAVSGVWFFRIGFMAWNMFHGRPVGFDPASFTGPVLSVLQALVYILPLAILELYLRAKAKGTPSQKLATAFGILLLSAVMAWGILGATMGMWLPRL
ncbi:MAG: DUF2306 domain-containing protein [Alphaproteobacteria bacterium]|nr:DUF2306 domain-containing protein [Alphaproteobacteria bacterium]